MPKQIVEMKTKDGMIYVEADVVQSKRLVADTKTGVLKAANSLENSLEPIVNVSKNILKKLQEVEIRKPTDIELKFAIKLGGKVDFWVIAGDGEGSIELTMTWKAEQ